MNNLSQRLLIPVTLRSVSVSHIQIQRSFTMSKKKGNRSNDSSADHLYDEKKLLLWRKDRLEAELRLVNEYLESFPIPGEQVKSNYDVKNSRMGNEKSVKPCAGGNIHLNTTEENKDKEDESDQKMEDMFDEKSDHNQDMLANRFDVYGDGRPETDVVYWTDGLSIRRTWKDGKWFYETCTDL